MTTAFYTGMRPHYIPHHHNPRMRQKPVHHSHCRLPKNSAVILLIFISLAVSTRHIGLFSSMTHVVASVFPSGDQLFAYHPVNLDRAMQFGEHHNSTHQSHLPASAHPRGNHTRGELAHSLEDETSQHNESQLAHPHHDPDSRQRWQREESLFNTAFDDQSSHKNELLQPSLLQPQPHSLDENLTVTPFDAAVDHDNSISHHSHNSNTVSDALRHQQDTPAHEKQSNNSQDDRQSESGGLKKDSVEELPTLKSYLNFTEATAINFMHFHKTGGVSFKTTLHEFYDKKFKASGQQVIIRDACYQREGIQGEGRPSFMLWRCDWNPIREQSEPERNKHDFVFGHQFGKNGVDQLLNRRDLRTFTVMRHPFDRKVSFFYHFFVREVGRQEEDISFEEIRQFLLFDQLRIEANLGRDLGPNYMAGRLLTDGIKGFVGNKSYSYFAVEPSEREQVVNQALGLIRDYVFVGLQSQPQASQCMLRKVIEEFNAVNVVSNEGTDQIDEKKVRLNSGTYSMSAQNIWGRLSREDRMLFDRKERVDLSIYEEGERLFKKHVEIYGCEHRLVTEQ